MNAKNDIILTMHEHARTQQVEMEQLRRELHSASLTLSAANCEIFQLKDRNLLQHSSWMLTRQIRTSDEAKLKTEIAHLNACLDQKAIRIDALEDTISDLKAAAALRESPLSRLLQRIERIFRS